MRLFRPVHHPLCALLAGTLSALAFGAAPAAATICPGGTDPLSDYCSATPNFAALIAADNPESWFRMSDGTGSDVMDDTSPNNHDGQYKNRQESGPVGVSADGNNARFFWGESGYGFINGIPGPGNGYLSYTLEAWFYATDTDAAPLVHNDGTIAQFGGGPSLYILSNSIRFRNGNDVVLWPGTFQDNAWYHVVGRKSGTTLNLFVNKSPSSPTPFDYTPATGSSTYLPNGSPTFYVGYGEHAPWFHGALDEVAFYDYALTDDQIAYHFYADPAPEGAIAKPADPAPASSTSASSSPKPRPTFSDNSSNAAARAKAAKLKAGKADVKRLKGVVAKTRRWLGSLRYNHAPAKAIAKARAQLKRYTAQLKRARAKVKSLS
jgi:hypothetical protein